ncbi:MAG: antibiotic biosynthesis monooxygenase [Proteobacteria bacterium]|nr:antibiotic biosynthesis monooxygenase [Pseudomonadota bacterium]
MIIITGSMTVRPENLAKALELGIEHSRRSRAEPGCVAHNRLTDGEAPNRIVFIEEWTDMDAVKAHFAVPESGHFVRTLSAMGDGAPEMRIFEAAEIQH